MPPLRRSKRPHRGPWSPAEQAAIDAAVAEGRVARVETGSWPERWRERLSWRKIQAEMFASQREPQ